MSYLNEYDLSYRTRDDFAIGKGLKMSEELRTIIREELAPLRVRVDGIPLISRKLAAIDQNVRMLKSAFNDFALTNPTSGEIQALHDDVNTVQAENMELATKIATLERLVEELQQQVKI
jgi:hypothetical protein